MVIVAISDVHGKFQGLTIPECDILISAGDYTFRNDQSDLVSFHTWLSKQPARHIISVQGNHERWVEKNFSNAKDIVNNISSKIFFTDEGTFDIEGIKIHCSAITPWFFNWAWNRRRGDDIKKHWDLIPEDTDILVTHGPAYGQLDMVYRAGVECDRVGCMDLLNRINKLKKLKYHIFGHIHCSAGKSESNGVKFINAAVCDDDYNLAKDAFIIHY